MSYEGLMYAEWSEPVQFYEVTLVLQMNINDVHNGPSVQVEELQPLKQFPLTSALRPPHRHTVNTSAWQTKCCQWVQQAAHSTDIQSSAALIDALYPGDFHWGDRCQEWICGSENCVCPITILFRRAVQTLHGALASCVYFKRLLI